MFQFLVLSALEYWLCGFLPAYNGTMTYSFIMAVVIGVPGVPERLERFSQLMCYVPVLLVVPSGALNVHMSRLHLVTYVFIPW